MLEARAALVREWIEEATAYIHDQLDGDIEIQSKSNRKDLVTNVDRKSNYYLDRRLQKTFQKTVIPVRRKWGTHRPIWLAVCGL